MSYIYGLDKEKVSQPFEYEQLIFKEMETNFELKADEAKEQLSDAEAKEIKDSILAYADVYKKQLETGDKQYREQVKDFPKEIYILYTSLYHIVKGAESYQQDGEFIRLGFSLNHFNLLKDQKSPKAIKHDFNASKDKDAGKQAFLQFSIDDNFLSSILSLLTNSDNVYIVREILKNLRWTSTLTDHLKTTLIGMALPEFSQEFGDGKLFDVKFTFDHSYFKKGIPGAKMSSINMDKNGNWKFRINLALSLLV